MDYNCTFFFFIEFTPKQLDHVLPIMVLCSIFVGLASLVIAQVNAITSIVPNFVALFRAPRVKLATGMTILTSACITCAISLIFGISVVSIPGSFKRT